MWILQIWRGRIERFHPENVIQHDRYGGGSVMIWGGINHYGKINLVTVNGTPFTALLWFLKFCRFRTRVKLPYFKIA
jgi:hypothetical protein